MRVVASRGFSVACARIITGITVPLRCGFAGTPTSFKFGWVGHTHRTPTNNLNTLLWRLESVAPRAQEVASRNKGK